MIKRCLILLLTVLCLGASNVSARVCFLPDAKDCGQGDTNMPEANNTVIPCDHTSCNDTSWYNTTHEDCYKSGACVYKRCRLTQEKCEKTRQKNEECKLDVGTGCYYTKEIDKCSSLYNRTQNDIHGDCKECVDKQGSHWYCQYDTCNDLYSGSSSNPTCTDGTTKKQIGTSINEGACYICSIDPNPETCDTYQDEEKVGIDRGCWECDQCPSDRSKFRCRQNIREGYEIKNGVCQISSQAKTCKQLGEEKNEHWKGDRIDRNCSNPAEIKGVFGSDGQCYKCGATDSTCKTGTAKVWIVYYAGHQVNNQCTADYNIGYLSQYAAKLSNGTNNVEVYSTTNNRPVSISITSSTKPYYIIQNTNWTLTSQAPVAYLLTKETFDSYVQAKGASFDINGANPSLSCPKFLIGDISSYKQSANISCAGEYVILVGYPSSDNSSGRVPDIGDKMEL